MKNKLMSLLLEIYEKEIFREHGCRTIYEYAFKYAKLSKETVNKALQTLRKVEDKPCLKKMIETQGIYKVAIVATLATPETDKVFAQHVENMSKPALFEFAKELRHGSAANANETAKCHAAPQKLTIELDEELQILFLRLKNKYAKDFSNKEALKVLLRKLTEYSDTTKKVDHAKENSVPGSGKQKRQKTSKYWLFSTYK